MWIDVLVVAAIVTGGTAIAGATNDPQPDAMAIPGCDVVQPAQDGVSFAIGTYGGNYDNPDYPWLTASKATTMSDALIESLPTGVELQFAAPSTSLVFQPIDVYPSDASLPDGITAEDISGDSTASGIVEKSGVSGRLRVSVQEWDRGVPACVAEQLDERTTLPGGTVVDTSDAVSVLDGEPTHRRYATAYFADTIVSATMSNDGENAALPLEVGELRDIVSNPELRASATVPDGTPLPRRDCGSSRENPVPPLPREQIERIGSSLGDQWARFFPDARTDRPLNDLLPGRSGSGSACTSVTVVTPSGPSELTVDISVQEGSAWRDAGESSSPRVNGTTLPDGGVVTRWSDEFAAGARPSEYVSVLRPSNTRVQFGFGEGIDVDTLVALASSPGLDL